MNKNITTLLVIILIASTATAQSNFHCIVQDGETHSALIGATVFVEKSKQGTSTDTTGSAVLQNIPNGTHTIRVTMVGYTPKTIRYVFPAPDTISIITL